MESNYISGAMAAGGVGVNRKVEDRNPDAVSSRMDQVASNLASIEDRLRDILIRIRGHIPVATDGSINKVQEVNLQMSISSISQTTDRISDSLNELRSLL